MGPDRITQAAAPYAGSCSDLLNFANFQLTLQSRIFLAVQPVDFRKGIDDFAALCRQTLQENP
jgi:hypothetical protein